MNPAQTKLMRWLDSEWAKNQRAQGKPTDRNARLEFYGKVIGRRVTSSSQLKNDDVTAIKRRVLSLAQPANYQAQFKSQVDNDPETIRRGYNERIDVALHVLKPDGDFTNPRMADDVRVKYARNTAERMYHVPWHELTTEQLRALVGLFEARAKSRQKRDEEAALRHAVQAGEESDGNPF